MPVPKKLSCYGNDLHLQSSQSLILTTNKVTGEENFLLSGANSSLWTDTVLQYPWVKYLTLHCPLVCVYHLYRFG